MVLSCWTHVLCTCTNIITVFNLATETNSESSCFYLYITPLLLKNVVSIYMALVFCVKFYFAHAFYVSIQYLESNSSFWIKLFRYLHCKDLGIVQITAIQFSFAMTKIIIQTVRKKICRPFKYVVRNSIALNLAYKNLVGSEKSTLSHHKIF
jgi:hypothetical protein